MQPESHSHTESPLVVTRITAKAILRRVQSMMIDFLRGQENCAVWPTRKRAASAALRPALLTEQFLAFDVEPGRRNRRFVAKGARPWQMLTRA
jgi:hypothetical protein